MERKIKRVAIYCRVSTDEQANNWVSLDNQRDSIIEFVEARKDEYILESEEFIYIDGWYSGSTVDRPWLMKLEEDAREWKFDIVLVYKIDRFFRNTLWLLQSVSELWKLGVWFKATTQEFDTSEALWKLMLWILWAIAELERDMIRERTISWKLKRANDGWYSSWWSVKLWYNLTREEGWKKLEVNKEEAKVVKRIFDLYVNENKSLWEVARLLEWTKTKYDILNEWKKHNKKHKIWHWTAGSVRGVLTDSIYIWKFYYWKTYTGFDIKKGKNVTKYRLKWDPNIVEIPCKRLLPNDDIFNKAQELLERNKLTKNNKSSHSFTSYIDCWECSKKYIWYKSSKWTIHYRCWGSTWWKLPKELRCKNHQVSELYLIDVIWDKVREIFTNADDLLEKYYSLKSWSNKILKWYEKELNDLTIDNEKLSNGFVSINTQYNTETSVTKKRLYKKSLEDVELKLETNELRIEEVEQRIKEFSEIEKNKKNVMDYIAKFKDNFEKIEGTEKVEFIKEILESIKIQPNGDVIITFKFWLSWDDNWNWWDDKSPLNKGNGSWNEKNDTDYSPFPNWKFKNFTKFK